jgi:hypothetical protein
MAAEVQLIEVQPGVYDCRWGIMTIRVVVTSRLPEEDHNAILHLFSAQSDRVRFGAARYRQRSADTSTLITTLFEHYQLEGLPMPYTMEEFKRDFLRDHLDELSPEERLKGLTPEELLKVISMDDLARVLSRDQIEAVLAKRRQAEESN